jgi:hypothetical protein
MDLIELVSLYDVNQRLERLEQSTSAKETMRQ